jgi:lipopolysaccharide biosynthesis glycosyltransferase
MGVTPGRMRHPLVLACDEGYAMQLATTLRSIVEANRNDWPLDFHVLSDGYSEDMRRKVLLSLPKGSASIKWVDVDLRPFGEFATLPHISKMTYARFLIPQVFPASVSRVLYLDADLLVLDDLEPLWETNLEGAVVGAVIDKADQQLKEDDPEFEGVPRVRDYFNAGVLLIDLNQWREKQISGKALEYLIQHPQSPFSDQDALNVVCDGLWKKLDGRWNFQQHWENRIMEMSPDQRPGIVHFIRREKPWDARIPNLNASFYDAYRSRTCFARNPWDKLRDRLQGVWCRLKGVLRRYSFLRFIWKRVRLSLSI